MPPSTNRLNAVIKQIIPAPPHRPAFVFIALCTDDTVWAYRNDCTWEQLY